MVMTTKVTTRVQINRLLTGEVQIVFITTVPEDLKPLTVGDAIALTHEASKTPPGPGGKYNRLKKMLEERKSCQ